MVADSARNEARGRARFAWRPVLELAFWEGLSYRQVANALGIPEGTAKSRIRLALTKLSAMLGEVVHP